MYKEYVPTNQTNKKLLKHKKNLKKMLFYYKKQHAIRMKKFGQEMMT